MILRGVPNTLYQQTLACCLECQSRQPWIFIAYRHWKVILRSCIQIVPLHIRYCFFSVNEDQQFVPHGEDYYIPISVFWEHFIGINWSYNPQRLRTRLTSDSDKQGKIQKYWRLFRFGYPSSPFFMVWENYLPLLICGRLAISFNKPPEVVRNSERNPNTGEF